MLDIVQERVSIGPKNKKRSHDQAHLVLVSPVTFVILCPVATLFKKEEVQI